MISEPFGGGFCRVFFTREGAVAQLVDRVHEIFLSRIEILFNPVLCLLFQRR